MTNYFGPKLDSHTPGVHLETRARMVMAFIERWGMVAGEHDGEDSAGRQKLRLATPNELTERACEIADAAVQAFEKRGWIQPAISFDEFRQVMRIYNRAKSGFTRKDDEEYEAEVAKAAGLL